MSVKDTQKTEALIEALLSLKTPDEARRFVRYLLTESEIVEFSNRFCAARMLNDKVPYSVIEKETGLSSTTVARVSKWLTTGRNGYQTVINRLNTKHPHLSHPVGKGLSS